MSEVYRSSIFGVKEETTEGTLVTLSAANFIPIREGFVFEGAIETVESDEFVDDIGKSKTFTAKEAPRGTLPRYLRHSGTEGVAPEFSVMIKSAMGSQTDNSTEYSTSGSSSAGTSTARAYLDMGSNDEDQFLEGQCVLIKDVTNTYSIRNVYEIDSANNQLDLNYNLDNTPATGTALGKAIHFRPTGIGHVSYSAYHYQSSSSSAFFQAMAGCKTTNMNISFPANALAVIDFQFEGTRFYFNPITITASSNDSLDFNDGGGEENVTLTAGVYNNPHDLAREISAKMNALTGDTITVSYSNTSGKFSISTSGTLSLLWNTGSGSGTTVGTTIGFAVAADDTGATTYTSDNALTYNPPATPTYDDVDSIMVKSSQLYIGSFNENICRPASNVNFTIATPKTDIPSVCADSGIDSSIINSRNATMTATIVLNEHEAGFFDKYINNTTTQVMFNTGVKSANNWVAGKCVNVYMGNASITAATVGVQDGYTIFNISAQGFVNSARKDIHINFI